MAIFDINHQRQRPKRRNWWPKWVRNPFLLRSAILAGLLIYRLWRWWRWLVELIDS